MTALTTLGSLFSTLLAAPLAPFLTRFFPRPIELTRAALEGSSSNSKSSLVEPKSPRPSTNNTPASTSSGASSAWVRLAVLRLVGIVPWSALNVACGVTGVSIRDCVAGAFIGTLPWTAVTCQIGDILRTVGVVSSSSTSVFVDGMDKSATLQSVLASPQMMFELVFLSVLSLAPILGRKRLSKLISPSEDTIPSVELGSLDTETVDLTDEDDDPSPRSPYAMKEGMESENYGRRGRCAQRQRQRWTWKRLSMSIPRWSSLHPNSHQNTVKEQLDRNQ